MSQAAVGAALAPGRSVRPPPANPARRRRIVRTVVVALLALLAAGAAGLALWRIQRADRSPPVRYETAAVQRGPVTARVNANGTLSAIVTVQVGSQVSGRIESLLVDFNADVKADQVVATIEPSSFRAALARAQANAAVARAEVDRIATTIELAERRHQRARELLAEGLGSRSDLDTAEAELKAARASRASAQAALARAHAELQEAQLDLQHTTIRSPIDGVVVSRNVDVGQTVAATLQAPTLFTIAQDLTRMQVDTSVAEADVGKIEPGMPVTFTVDAYPDRTFEGRVRQVRNAAQTIQNVVTYDAVVDVANPERLLRPGMTANVTFVHARKDDVLLVPNAALRFRPDPRTAAAMGDPAVQRSRTLLEGDQRQLWVLRDGRATPLVVKVGLTDGRMSEVVEGALHEGDEVVTEAAATSS